MFDHPSPFTEAPKLEHDCALPSVGKGAGSAGGPGGERGGGCWWGSLVPGQV
jgi:hypothetical protein